MATWSVKIGTYALGTQAAVNAIKIISQKRLSEYPIIRKDMTIVPDGNMMPLKIEVRGTIAGSDYTSLRTEIMALRKAMQGGKQEFYIDNERYARIIGRSLDYSFITNDFCNYNAMFECELPVWLAVTAKSYITMATNGSTYNLNYQGEFEAPLKVVFTAPSIGSSSTLQLENTTLNLISKFNGILTATQELIFETGYSFHNVPTYQVKVGGISALSAFEGDFLWLKEGNNTIKFTGAINPTLALYWREGYFA